MCRTEAASDQQHIYLKTTTKAPIGKNKYVKSRRLPLPLIPGCSVTDSNKNFAGDRQRRMLVADRKQPIPRRTRLLAILIDDCEQIFGDGEIDLLESTGLQIYVFEGNQLVVAITRMPWRHEVCQDCMPTGALAGIGDLQLNCPLCPC